MDEIDLALLHAMGIRRYGVQASNRDDFRAPGLARRLGVDPTTAYDRLRRLEESGFLRGYALFPNLRLLGRRERVYFFHGLDAAKKDDAFRELAQIEGLVECHDFFGGSFCVDMTVRDEPDAASKLARVREVLGQDGDAIFEGSTPATTVEPDRLDWRILHALRGDALLPLPELSAAVGSPTRTVRRRLDRLTQGNAYFVLPMLDASKGEGAVFVVFLVWVGGDVEKGLARVRSILGPRTLAEQRAIRGTLYVLAAARSVPEVDRLERLLVGTEGVEKVESYLVQGLRSYEGWVDDELARRAA